MEHSNGTSTSSMCNPVDTPRDHLDGEVRRGPEPPVDEWDAVDGSELAALRRQVSDLSLALDQARSDSEVRAEIGELRQEFATSMAALHGLVTEGDGDLHEMQLTSLRRQVSQIEGVLESNYQRELRVAEER